MTSRVVIILAALLMIASSAGATRKVQIFSDESLTQNSIDDSAPAIRTFYVVDTGDIPATGVELSIQPGPDFTGVWLNDASAFVTVGASPTDISVGYRACVTLPVVALTVTYQMFGTSAPCSELRVAPPRGLPCIISPDTGCFWAESCIRDTTSLRVNCPVAAEPTTWGRVKSLYRN